MLVGILYNEAECMWLPVNTPKLAGLDDSNRKVGSDVTTPLLSTPCVDKAQ